MVSFDGPPHGGDHHLVVDYVSIVNTIGGKYLRALRRPNKGRKYNSNTLKNRNNRMKRLALLGGCPSR